MVENISSAMKPVNKSFCEKTTIHGLLDYAEGRNKYIKWFWIAVMLLAILAMIIEVYFSVVNYLNCPLVTSNSIKIIDEFKIPAIYLCPNNAVDERKIKYKNQYDFVNGFFNGPPDLNSGNANVLGGKRGNAEYFGPPESKGGIDTDENWSVSNCSCGNDNNLDQYGPFEYLTPLNEGNMQLDCMELASNGSCLNETTYPSAVKLPYPPTELLPPPIDLHEYIRDPQVAYAQQPTMEPPENMWEFFEYITLSPDKFYIDCTVRNKPKNCSAMSRSIFDLDYGRCFMLDVHESQISPGKAVMVVADSRPNIKMASLITGITVSFVDHYNPLKVSLDKFYISPGTFTKISLHATNYKQINVDTGSVKQVCIEKGDSLWNKQFQFVNLTNDEWSCQLECSLAMSYRYCGCVTPFEKSVINYNYWDSTCGYSDYIMCLKELTKDNETRRAETRNCISKCVPLCEMWLYSYSISSAPLNQNFLRAKTRLNITGEAMDAYSNIFSDIVVLDIAYADLQYTEISQSLSTTADTFLSNIGGQFGLWIGASLLSLIQLLEFCISWMFNRLSSKLRIKKVNIRTKAMLPV